MGARGLGREAIARLLHAVYGTRGTIDTYDFRGKTDPRIVNALTTLAGRIDERARASMVRE